MIQGYGPVFQTLLGTLLTWGLTAAGAALVAVIPGTKVILGLCVLHLYVCFRIFTQLAMYISTKLPTISVV